MDLLKYKRGEITEMGKEEDSNVNAWSKETNVN